MYKSKLLSQLLATFIIVISFLVSIYLFVNQNNLPISYKYLYLLPLSYGLFYSIFLNHVSKKYGFSLFLCIYITVSFFRYVVLSYLIFKSGWYYGRSNFTPSIDKFQEAIYLMIYELFIYNLFILLFHKYLLGKIKVEKTNEIKFNKNNFVYIAFVVFTFILVTIKPASLQFFSFFSINTNYRPIEESDALVSIIIIFVNISRYIIYFMIIKFLITRLSNRNPFLSFTLVVLATLVNSMIFFGTNRSDFIFNFIINLIMLIYLYKKAGIILSSILVAIVPIVVSNMTKYRDSVTITKGSSKLIDFTDYLQIYLGGVYNVAMSLDMELTHRNPLLILVDIFRSAIGPNIFLKNIDIVSSSKLFNSRLFSTDLVSQIIPMIGQAKLYFGFAFAPLLGVVFIFISLLLLRQLLKVHRFELIYIFTLFSGRLGFVMAQNGNILLNDLTFFLPLFLFIYFLNNRVVITNEK